MFRAFCENDQNQISRCTEYNVSEIGAPSLQREGSNLWNTVFCAARNLVFGCFSKSHCSQALRCEIPGPSILKKKLKTLEAIRSSREISCLLKVLFFASKWKAWKPWVLRKWPKHKFLAAQNTGFQRLEPPHCSERAPISETLYYVQREIWFLAVFAKLAVPRPSVLRSPTRAFLRKKLQNSEAISFSRKVSCF